MAGWSWRTCFGIHLIRFLSSKCGSEFIWKNKLCTYSNEIEWFQFKWVWMCAVNHICAYADLYMCVCESICTSLPYACVLCNTLRPVKSSEFPLTLGKSGEAGRAASAWNEEASVFLTVHGGVKKRGRRGNEMNWSRRMGGGRERERENTQKALSCARCRSGNQLDAYWPWSLRSVILLPYALRQWGDARTTANRLNWETERDFIHSPDWYSGRVEISTQYQLFENITVRTDLQKST